MIEFSHDQFQRIRDRANDPMRRTYMARMEAEAQPMDFTQLTEDLRRHGAPGAMGLLNMAGKLEGLLSQFGGAIAMGPDGPMRFGGQAPSSELAHPPSPQLVNTLEMRMGRPIPACLRQLYEIGDGGFGPGSGLMPLIEIARRYDEFTHEPFGPLGQDWPEQLLPLFEEEPVLVCMDLESGEIVAWDPEEIEDEESEEDWQRSFKVEYPDLAALMDAWLDSSVFGE